TRPEPEYTTTPSPAARTGAPALPARPMPCRVGSPSTYRLTSCPSAGQRQATALVAGAGPVGCGGVRVGCTVRPRLSVTGREPPAGGRAVDAVRAGVEAVREPPAEGYRRSTCPG